MCKRFYSCPRRMVVVVTMMMMMGGEYGKLLHKNVCRFTLSACSQQLEVEVVGFDD